MQNLLDAFEKLRQHLPAFALYNVRQTKKEILISAADYIEDLTTLLDEHEGKTSLLSSSTPSISAQSLASGVGDCMNEAFCQRQENKVSQGEPDPYQPAQEHANCTAALAPASHVNSFGFDITLQWLNGDEKDISFSSPNEGALGRGLGQLDEAELQSSAGDRLGGWLIDVSSRYDDRHSERKRLINSRETWTERAN